MIPLHTQNQGRANNSGKYLAFLWIDFGNAFLIPLPLFSPDQMQKRKADTNAQRRPDK